MGVDTDVTEDGLSPPLLDGDVVVDPLTLDMEPDIDDDP